MPFLLLLALALVPAIAASLPRRAFGIEAGDATVTLRQFVAQSGEQVVYFVDSVRGVRTNPLRGEFTVRDALDHLLAKTVLVAFEDEATGAWVIKRTAPPGETSALSRTSLPPHLNR